MEERILEILKEADAFLEGHFLLSSGRHSDKYMQMARLLRYPWLADEVMAVLADKMREIDIDVLVGPAVGGIIAAYELGRQLRKEAIFTERENGVMTLRRGFTIEKGAKCAVVEDVITTAKSSYETKEAIEKLGGIVTHFACIVDRSDASLKIDIPIISAVKMNIQTFDAWDCPLCKAGGTAYKPGSRA